jgi:2-oxoglutarate ferredoxin oxidoreductase subunit alpha
MKVEFISSNEASAEGAMAAGLKVYVGYPITPSSDLFEYLTEKLPLRGGIFLQAEDEIATINALVGAALAGAKAMTATSGPGFSLMAEGIGFASMVEAPLVIVNDMRAGPSTGIATQVGQGDVMQAKWCSHGPYSVVSYAPASAQEAFDYTVEAFNTAIRLRLPVVVLMDATLAHTRERVIVKEPNELNLVEFKKPKVPPELYKPYEPDPDDLVPPMAFFGEGYYTLAESLSHDEKGYYNTDPLVYRKLVERLLEKVERNKKEIVASKSYYTKDAEILFVAFGSVARSTLALVRDLREKGIKAGLFRPISIWPIDDEALLKAVAGAKKVVVVELNQGQLVEIVERVFWKAKKIDIEVLSLPMILPETPSPDEIFDEMEEKGWRLW